MRLVSYGPFGQERAGILVDATRIIDLEQAGAPSSDMRLILEQPDWREAIDRAYAARANVKALELGAVRLGCPVPVPRSLLIAGANTKSHFKEAAPLLKDAPPPKEPMILAKATSCLCGPYDDVIHPPETTKLDYEVEVGIVIGKKARRIKESQVKYYVAGFTTVNEMSARDIQLAEKEDSAFYRVHFLGKSFDTFCPAGPTLVTVDEFEWGKPLKMRTEVNGEVRQNSDTSDLFFGFETLVSFISQVMTLYPGDIIASGSPAGVAFFMKPPGFLKPGDVVKCEVEGIGYTENRIRAEVL